MISKIMINFVLSASILFRCGDALPTTMEKMTVSRMRMADLESSATGYVYNHQPGRPASYVHYANHGTGGYYDAPRPVQYVTYGKPGEILHSGSTVITSLPAYKNEASPLPPGYIVPLLEAPKNPALAPYYVPAKIHPEPANFDENNEEDDGDNHNDDTDSGEDDHGDNGDFEEEHEDGESFNAEENSSHGENGKEGYKSYHEFNNGRKGEHHKDKHEGNYREEGGNAKSHSESAGNYDDHDESDKGNEDESYGEQNYHKKGHKTTGFHNVYHKDEYKKDTDFYDDNHKSGHYDKHSSSGQHHSSADGGYEKGERHNSGHKDHENGKAGHYDKGHESSRHEGFKSKEGADSYHKNHSDYAAKSEAEENKRHGYVDGHQ